MVGRWRVMPLLASSSGVMPFKVLHFLHSVRFKVIVAALIEPTGPNASSETTSVLTHTHPNTLLITLKL